MLAELNSELPPVGNNQHCSPTMLSSPAEASATIAQHLPKMPVEDCGIEAAHGRVLRSAIVADRPMPVFDRVTMDGFAVRAADFGTDKNASAEVVGFQAAGMIARTLSKPGTAIEIATGAVLSAGADAIVPYEDADRDGDRIRLREGAPRIAGQNIHRCGSDCAAGKELVAPGTVLTGREIAVAASTGCSRLQVSARPSIADRCRYPSDRSASDPKVQRLRAAGCPGPKPLGRTHRAFSYPRSSHRNRSGAGPNSSRVRCRDPHRRRFEG